MAAAMQIVVNAGSGSVAGDESCDELREHFSAAGIAADFHFARGGDDIVEYARKVCAGDADVIVAGGGDGTVSAVATEVFKAGKTLGVLPLGTLNNFSKDLGIPPDIADAVQIIANRNIKEIDLAEVNERIFINNSSIGLYPRIVRRREQQQSRLGHGKWRAAIWATLRIFRVSRFLKVRIEIDGKTFLRKTPFVFVGNNGYEMDLYNIGRRERLDGGQLSVCFMHRGGRWGVVKLLLHTLVGGVKQWRDFEEVHTREITIQSRRSRLSVAFDGEVSVLETPLVYKILPKALKVIVPASAKEE